MNAHDLQRGAELQSLVKFECFIRSAEMRSFPAAARSLSITPAAVSRNILALERSPGTRLFQRSTRQLTLTEAGEGFYSRISDSMKNLLTAIDDMSAAASEPAGTLKISMSRSFGLTNVIGLLPDFLTRYPLIKIDWRLENRRVDLIAERLDAAIGAGNDLPPEIVMRTLAPHHIIAVAAPAYLDDKALPEQPADLRALDGIVARSMETGLVREWTMRQVTGEAAIAEFTARVIMSDREASLQAVLLGMGVALVSMADAEPYLSCGSLIRVLPKWYVDAGVIGLYYSSRSMLPPKTRAFIDYLVPALQKQNLIERFDATKHVP